MGRYYIGRIPAGIPWLIITLDLWIGTGSLLGRTARVVAVCTAYAYACNHRVGT